MRARKLQCEVCGRKIRGDPSRVEIEGARLTVCGSCSRHGKIIWEEPRPRPEMAQKKPRPPLKLRPKQSPQIPPKTTVELVEDFDVRIRQAREKSGLSHEELGKKINEKVSLLRKIEMKKMTPDNLLAAKLERTLKVKLIVPAAEEKDQVPQKKDKATHGLTLGDLVQIDRKPRKEDTAKRK